MQQHNSPNRLIHAKSPYLLQHAYNPVDWYEWGDEALSLAHTSNRPILLSVGYSACHWCHVMEHESFSDPVIAALMNAYFVCIKVDREERPDIDAIYMTAVQRMTGQGGWPMTMFLTPEGNPFYGGTYFPPTDRGRMPSFTRVLQSVQVAWKERPDQLRQAGLDLRDEITTMLGVPTGVEPVDRTVIDIALQKTALEFDATYGGFGGAPKFPPSMTIGHLLRAYQRTQDTQLLQMATYTLDAMAAGGMYDQIGGGFHRYSVDAYWQIPHFEKMLYDNGLLLKAYAEGFQLTRNREYARICGEIVEWAITELQDAHGAFYSALDADTEGEEGKFYVWSGDELEDAWGAHASILRQFFGVDGAPNFEGVSYVIERHKTLDAFAHANNLAPAALHDIVTTGIERLKTIRSRRVYPHCDTKIIASWNGLMISGLATAGRVLGQSTWLEIAQRALDFVQYSMMDQGLLYRIWKDNAHGNTIGFLDDYANIAEAALTLYQANGNTSNLVFAKTLTHQIVQRFYDEATQRLYDNSDLHEQLIVRPVERTDNATPSGTATTIDLLSRMSIIADEPYYGMIAEQLITSYVPLVSQWPLGFGQILQAMERFVMPSIEIVIAGDGQMREIVHANAPLVAVILDAKDADISVLCQNKSMINDKQTVYICRNNICEAPITTIPELQRALHAL